MFLADFNWEHIIQLIVYHKGYTCCVRGKYLCTEAINEYLIFCLFKDIGKSPTDTCGAAKCFNRVS